MCARRSKKAARASRLQNAPDGEQADVRVWQEDESPYQRVAQGLKERGIATGKLGIEETMRFVFADGIAKAASQASARQRDAGHRRMPHDQERARNCADAPGVAGHAGGLSKRRTWRVKDGMTQRKSKTWSPPPTSAWDSPAAPTCKWANFRRCRTARSRRR